VARRKVLIVDDDPARRGALRTILEREGHAVEVSSPGDEAVRAVKSSEPALVITNCDSPTWTDEELAPRILREGLETRLILITGSRSRAVSGGFFRAGGSAVFEKPFELRDLLAAIRASIGDPHRINRHLAAERARDR
jgi:DNA-binding NtrC family response regulator